MSGRSPGGRCGTEGEPALNKRQLIEALSSHYDGNRKAARHALESVVDTITREVARGEKVAISGFGAFEKAVRPARMVRNPRTGERKPAEKTAVPRFRAGAGLKAVVSGARKLPAAAVTTTAREATAASPARTADNSAPARTTRSARSASSASGTARSGTATSGTAKKASAAKKAGTAPASTGTGAKPSAAKNTGAAKTTSAKDPAAATKNTSTTRKTTTTQDG